MQTEDINMDFTDWTNTDLEFELTLDRTKNDEARARLIQDEVQRRKIDSLEDELKRKKGNTLLMKVFNYTIAGILILLIALFALIFISGSSKREFDPSANYIAGQIFKAIPSGDLNNIKTLFHSNRWLDLNNQETKDVFLTYKVLGKHLSNTSPAYLRVEVMSGSQFESIATYQSYAKFTEGDVELLFQVAKYSDAEFKLFSIHVNSAAFGKILHNKALKL